MEEERTSNPAPDNTDQGVLRFPQDGLPFYYSVKIESFSRLVNLKIEKYESAMFHASGFNGRLILYPNGNAEKGGEGYISLYLAIDNTETLPPSWEAYVTFRMFVLNYHKKKFLTVPDDSGHQTIQFHQVNKETGFDRLLSLDTFNAAANGYLINDSCVFGVEVYEVKYTGSGEALKIIEDPIEVCFNVIFENLKPQHDSEEFIVGKHKWRLSLNPNGDGKSEDESSLYLELVESTSNVKKVLVEYLLVLENLCWQHKEETSGYKWFSTTESTTGVSSRWGFKVLQWRHFGDLGGCEVQAKVKIKAEVTNFF